MNAVDGLLLRPGILWMMWDPKQGLKGLGFRMTWWYELSSKLLRGGLYMVLYMGLLQGFLRGILGV